MRSKAAPQLANHHTPNPKRQTPNAYLKRLQQRGENIFHFSKAAVLLGLGNADQKIISATRQRAKEIYAAAGKKISDEEAQPDQLIKAADAGDKLADQVWADIGRKIGVGLTNVIWLVNPNRIVIGGGVANAGERLFGYIRRTIQSRCEKTFWEKLEVVSALLHNDAGIIGPATLAIESEFRRRPK
jgi:predicted NBD/HSP70 family sugar kinase